MLAAVVVLAALARTSTGHSVASSLGIQRVGEPFTALSFADPAYVGLRGVTYRHHGAYDRFGFQIRNEEHRLLTYRWTISVLPAGSTYHGSAVVRSGQAVVVSRDVRLTCVLSVVPGRSRHRTSPRRAQVRVALRPSGDHIAFWRSCGG